MIDIRDKFKLENLKINLLIEEEDIFEQIYIGFLIFTLIHSHEALCKNWANQSWPRLGLDEQA